MILRIIIHKKSIRGRTVFAKKNGNYYDVVIVKTFLKMLKNNGEISSLPID